MRYVLLVLTVAALLLLALWALDANTSTWHEAERGQVIACENDHVKVLGESEGALMRLPLHEGCEAGQHVGVWEQRSGVLGRVLSYEVRGRE